MNNAKCNFWKILCSTNFEGIFKISKSETLPQDVNNPQNPRMLGGEYTVSQCEVVESSAQIFGPWKITQKYINVL